MKNIKDKIEETLVNICTTCKKPEPCGIAPVAIILETQCDVWDAMLELKKAQTNHRLRLKK